MSKSKTKPLTTAEALQYVRDITNYPVKRNTFDTWIKKKKFPVKRLCGKILIDLADLDIFLADFTSANRKVGKLA